MQPKKPIPGKSLAALYPNYASEWHPTLNGKLTPFDVSPGSSYEAFWCCDKGHTWSASVNQRTSSRTNCPYCSGRYPILGETDLATVHPELLLEWDYEENGETSPTQISSGSGYYAHWICSTCGHKFGAIVSNRARKGSGCPKCKQIKARERACLASIAEEGKSIAVIFPHLLKEWHPLKNVRSPYSIMPGSDYKAYWICQNPLCRHEWSVSVGSRVYFNSSCPKCAKQKHVSFTEKAIFYYVHLQFSDALANVKKDIFPWLGEMELDIYIPSLQLAIEFDGYPWHDGKEKSDLYKIQLCERHGISMIRIRDGKLKPIFQDGRSLVLNSYSDDDIDTAIESLMSQINNNFFDININVARDKGKIFEALKPFSIEKSLGAQFPEIIKDWDVVRNGPLTAFDVPASSGHKVFWKCSSCGYEWHASPNQRVRFNKSGKKTIRSCKVCSYKQRGLDAQICESSKSLEAFYPELAAEWHPTKNKVLSPSNVFPMSGQEVWWNCLKCGHEWQAPVYSRVQKIRKKTSVCGCPECAKEMRAAKRMRPVKQYSLQGELIAEFRSIAAASRQTGIRQSGISACIRGDYTQSGGFIWR